MTKETKERARQIRADAERASRELTERLRARMASDAVAHITVHLLGERVGRTWCNKSTTAGIAIAERRPEATCEACIELDDGRREGIRSGMYRHPSDLALDERLGAHRPPTEGT